VKSNHNVIVRDQETPNE